MANDLTQPVYVDSQNSVRAFIIRYSFLIYVVLTLILGWYPWYLGMGRNSFEQKLRQPLYADAKHRIFPER